MVHIFFSWSPIVCIFCSQPPWILRRSSSSSLISCSSAAKLALTIFCTSHSSHVLGLFFCFSTPGACTTAAACLSGHVTTSWRNAESSLLWRRFFQVYPVQVVPYNKGVERAQFCKDTNTSAKASVMSDFSVTPFIMLYHGCGFHQLSRINMLPVSNGTCAFLCSSCTYFHTSLHVPPVCCRVASEMSSRSPFVSFTPGTIGISPSDMMSVLQTNDQHE